MTSHNNTPNDLQDTILSLVNDLQDTCDIACYSDHYTVFEAFFGSDLILSQAQLNGQANL